MIRKEIVTKFSGPPGTGKSTTLLNVVDGLLSSNVDPEQIVYTTFTRAGAYEARDRACKRFNIPAQRLPYFRTLHSLCLQLLPSVDVMSLKDWMAVGKKLHLFFGPNPATAEDGLCVFRTKGDVMLSLYTLARVKMISIDQVWAIRGNFKGPEILRSEFDRFVETVQNYKATFGKIDFVDMLEKYLRDGPEMHADYIIVDEAQDLSALQWAVVEKLCRNAKKVYVAGDDDQCIHEWNGAAPQHFINLQAENYSVLPQSYRIPATVHELANKIIRKVRNRLPKDYHPRNEPGEVKHISDLSKVDMSSGSWLLLAQNGYLLSEYEELCRERGYLYHSLSKARKDDIHVLSMISTWKKLQAGEKVPAREAVQMYTVMSQAVHVKRGFKTLLQKLPENEQVDYVRLQADFGLLVPKEWGWSMALNMLESDQVRYLLSLEKNKEIGAEPRIRILTIHSSKGLEADHVVLKSDLSREAYLSLNNNPEPEHRVFYVAVTRAKRSLYLLQPQSDQAYVI